MKKLAIIAALEDELQPLVKSGWTKTGDRSWTGQTGGVPAIAIAGGMGAAAATKAAIQALEFSPDALISYGWAGALTCAVKPGAVCMANEIVDVTTGEHYPTGSRDGFRILTLNHVALANEKRALAGEHKSVVAEMEAAAVARVAAQHGLTFYCMKGISDGYTDKLPDFNKFMTPEGQLNMGGLVFYAALRPAYWPALLRLGRQSKAAATGLAAELDRFVTTHQKEITVI
jgi:adenosylhomocysteine nucleosidase